MKRGIRPSHQPPPSSAPPLPSSKPFWRTLLSNSRLRFFITGFSTGTILTAAVFYYYSESNHVSKPAIIPTTTVPSKFGGSFLENTKFGYPGPVSDLLVRQAYVANFNRALRNPNWVAEHLTREKLSNNINNEDSDSDSSIDESLNTPINNKNNNNNNKQPDRSHSSFKEDPDVPKQFRARVADYVGSGFDRGHLVPAADVRDSQEALNETFYLTNVSPQVAHGFNRGYWSHLESFIRSLTKTFSDVYVITGPLYLPQRDPKTGKQFVRYEMIGNPVPHIAVPTHFYKIVLAVKKDTNEMAMEAFVLPNEPISEGKALMEFVTPVDAVERSSGLTFFTELEKQKIPSLCSKTACSLRHHAALMKQVMSNSNKKKEKEKEKAKAKVEL